MQFGLGLTQEERRILESLRRSRVSPAADVKRARLMVMLAEGLSWQAISQKLPCCQTISIDGGDGLVPSVDGGSGLG